MFRWFKREKTRSKRVWTFPEMKKFDIPDDLMIYLIGFSYDAPTNQMVTWLSDILVSRRANPVRIIRFNDNTNSDKEQLRVSLEDKTKRIELFCGHGSKSGLFGPQLQVTGSILSDLSLVIYDTEMITDTPSSMFAFCCQAAQTFGRVFSSLKDKQFMGFKDDIPFPLELYDDLKYVFQTVAKDIIQTGQISTIHRELFLQKIDEIGSQPGPYLNPTLLELWLDEYRKHLMLYA